MRRPFAANSDQAAAVAGLTGHASAAGVAGGHAAAATMRAGVVEGAGVPVPPVSSASRNSSVNIYSPGRMNITRGSTSLVSGGDPLTVACSWLLHSSLTFAGPLAPIR